MADFKIGLDVSDVKSAAAELEAALERINGSVKAQVTTFAQFNRNNKLIEANVRSINEAGQIIDQTLSRTKKGLDVTSTTVKAAAEQMDEFANAQKRAAEAARLLSAQTAVAPIIASFKQTTSGQTRAELEAEAKAAGIKGISRKNMAALQEELTNQAIAKASTAAQGRIAGAQQNLLGVVAKSGLNADEIQQIFDRINKGFSDLEFGARGKVQKALFDVKKAFEGIDEAAARANEKAQALASKLSQAAAAANKKAANVAIGQTGEEVVRKAFPAPTNATIEQINRYEASVQSIIRLLSSGKITLSSFLSILQQVQANPKAGIAGLTPDEATARAALSRLANGFKEVEDAGGKAAGRLFISFSGLIRLLETVVVRRIFREIIEGLSSTQSEAGKLSIALSRIQAVTQNNETTTRQWLSSFRDLADKNGINITEAATVAFEALGSKLRDTTTASLILGESFKLSRASGIDVKRSVELVQTALQAYNLTAQETAKVTQLLYSAQTVGNVNLEQFGLNFGKVAQLAGSLGVSLSQTLGIITTFANQGLRTNDALLLTQTILQKILSPTEELKNLYREWGVATGEMALQTFGFLGVFQKLQAEISKSGGGRLKELVSDVKSIRGASALLQGDVLGGIGKTIGDIEAGAGRLQNALAIVANNPRVRLSDEFNKINNYLQSDFAEKFAAIFAKSSDAVGGLSNLVKSAADAFLNLTTVVANFGTAFLSVLRSVSAILPSFQTLVNLGSAYVAGLVAAKTLTTAVTLAVAAYTAVTQASVTAITQRILAHFGLTAALGVGTAAQAANTAATTAGTAATLAFNAATAASILGLVAVAATAIYAYRSSSNAAKDAERAAAQRKAFGDPERIAQEAEDATQKAAQERQSKEISQFKKFYDDKIQIILQYSAKVNAQLAKQADAAQLGDNRVLANLAGGVEGFATNLQRDVKEAKDLQKEVLNNIDKSQQRIIGLRVNEEKRQFERSLSGAGNVDATALTFARVDQLKTKALDLFNKDQLEEARKTFEEIDKLLESIFQRQKTFDEKARKLGVVIPEGQSEVDKRITANQDLQISLEERYIRTQQNRYIQAIAREKAYQSNLRETEKIVQSTSRLQEKFNEAQQKRTSSEAILGKTSETIGLQGRELSSVFREKKPKLQLLDFFDEAQKRFAKNPNDNNLLGLNAIFDDVKEHFQGQNVKLQSGLPLDEALDRFKNEILKYSKGLNDSNEAAAQLQELEAQKKRLGVAIPDELKGPVAEAVQLQLNFQQETKALTDQIITSFKAILDSTKKLEEQVQPFQRGEGGVQKRSMGGFMKASYFADGGPVGTDVIPSWLSRGEYVMDAANTAKFFPQLVGMSSGIAPTSVNQSRSVNVGDINISYQGSDSVQTDVRRLGEQLRRELRRGTLRLD